MIHASRFTKVLANDKQHKVEKTVCA